MAKFRSKSPVFEAYQVGSKEALPAWLEDGFNTGQVLKDGQGRMYLADMSDNAFHPVQEGSWIIKNETIGPAFFVRHDNCFKVSYEKIDEPEQDLRDLMARYKKGPMKKPVDIMAPMTKSSYNPLSPITWKRN